MSSMLEPEQAMDAQSFPIVWCCIIQLLLFTFLLE